MLNNAATYVSKPLHMIRRTGFQLRETMFAMKQFILMICVFTVLPTRNAQSSTAGAPAARPPPTSRLLAI